MSTNVTLNGVAYAIPAVGDSNWGTVLSNYFIALSTGVLSKAGGTFTLTADANFGATYGLKSAYLKSQATNPSATGILRLGNAELLAWRNNANGADLGLTVNTSDQLTYNGNVLAASTGPAFQDSIFNIFDNLDITKKIAFQASAITTGTTRTLTMADLNVDLAALVNANISASAAIVDTKLDTIATALKVSNSATTATALNTVSAIVARDGSGNFAAGTITAALTGNATTATTVTTNANLTGDITSVGNATTLTNAPVIAKVLTGYTSGAGTVASTDSILQAIQKLNGNDATNANLTGPVTSVGNATSVANLAITNAMIAATTIDLTAKVTGVLPIANGGTNNGALAVTAGGVIYTDGSKQMNVGVGTAGQVLQSNVASAPSWVAVASAPSSSQEISNLGLATSVASSALTIALKQSDGSTDPGAAAAAVKVGMRSVTLTSGLYNQRSATAALSLVISSGSTLGQTSTLVATIWIYLIDNAGTLELAASGTLFTEDKVKSTTAEGGGGAADSATVLYSATARTNVPIRLIGKLVNTQATAGTWASAGTSLHVGDFAQIAASEFVAPTIQTFTSGTGTYTTPLSPRIPKYIKVRMVGGGGGGGGSGTGGSGGAGGIGVVTTFGSSLLTANAGTMSNAYTPATGGTATISSPAIGSSGTGGGGGGAHQASSSGNAYAAGGSGGTNIFGGSGAPSITGAGVVPVPNTGAGGTGAGTNGINSSISGAGGSAGGWVDAIINSPSLTYAYAVGTGGALGTAGTSGFAGTAGATGYIEVTEYYS